MIREGQYIKSGGATFLVVDVRDGTPIGDIRFSQILRPGYVQANGAVLEKSSVNYPRLVKFVKENEGLLAADETAWSTNKALYLYDEINDTLKMPDAIGRVIQGGGEVASIEAGLPNITGWLDSASYSGHGTQSGCFYRVASNIRRDYSSPHTDGNRYGMNASLSSALYGKSSTVQPSALSFIPQIRY